MKTKLWHLIVSRKTAFLLMTLLAILCLIGVNLPQITVATPSYYEQWKANHLIIASVAEILHFNRMYTSELFLSTITLLLIVMLFGIVNLYRTLRRKVVAENIQVDGVRFKHFFSFTTPQASALRISLLEAQRRGFTITEHFDKLVVLQKNRAGRWGGFIFHLGLVIIILAGLLTFLFENRGFVQLLERDTFFGQQADFLVTEQGPLAKLFAPDLIVSLKQVSPVYYTDGKLQSLESAVLIGKKTATLRPASLSINQPFEQDGVKVYQSTSFGYTVGLLMEKDGEAIPAYFSLDHPNKFGKPFVGYSDFPKTEYMLSIELVPDSKGSSFRIYEPMVFLKITKHGAPVYAGWLSVGQSATLDHTTLTFVDVRRWTGLIVTQNQFVPVVFLGFVFVIVGLALVYGTPLREIYVSVQQEEGVLQLSFGGKARREGVLFKEEFYALMGAIYLTEGIADVEHRLAEV